MLSVEVDVEVEVEELVGAIGMGGGISDERREDEEAEDRLEVGPVVVIVPGGGSGFRIFLKVKSKKR